MENGIWEPTGYLEAHQKEHARLVLSTADQDITMAHPCDRRWHEPHIKMLTVAKRHMHKEDGLESVFDKLRYVSANERIHSESYLC